MTKCNYTYQNLKRIYAAAISQMVDNKHVTMDEAKRHLVLAYGVLKICEQNKDVAKKLLKMALDSEKGKKE